MTIDRRTIARGGVWTVPAIVVGAPAPVFAASCAPVTLNWNNYPTETRFTSGTVGKTTVSLNISGAVNTRADNATVQYSSTSGGYNGNRLRFGFGATSGATERITFTFSAPVTNLSFTLYDIDALTSNWSDRVRFGTTPTTVSYGSNITVGSDANGTFYGAASANDIQDASGNLSVTYAGPVSSVSFTYYQGSYQTVSPVGAFIGLSNLTFTPTVC